MVYYTAKDSLFMENAKSRIVMLRMYSGDYIIGEEEIGVVNNGITVADTTDLKNPRMFVMMPTITGEYRAGFQSVCPFSEKCKKFMQIRNEQIMFKIDEDELGKEMVNGYNSHVSGIKIATASETAAVNGGADIII